MIINKTRQIVVALDVNSIRRIKAILEQGSIKLNSYRYRVIATKKAEDANEYRLTPILMSFGRRNCFTPIISIELNEKSTNTVLLIKLRLFLAVRIMLLVQCIAVLIIWLLMVVYLVYYHYAFSFSLLKPFLFVAIVPLVMFIICNFTLKSIQIALMERLGVYKDKK